MFVVGISDKSSQKWYIYGGLCRNSDSNQAMVGHSRWKRTFDQLVIKAPIFGEVVQKSAVAKLSRTLSTLLSSGVGLSDAIDISARTSGNAVIEAALLVKSL